MGRILKNRRKGQMRHQTKAYKAFTYWTIIKDSACATLPFRFSIPLILFYFFFHNRIIWKLKWVVLLLFLVYVFKLKVLDCNSLYWVRFVMLTLFKNIFKSIKSINRVIFSCVLICTLLLIRVGKIAIYIN